VQLINPPNVEGSGKGTGEVPAMRHIHNSSLIDKIKDYSKTRIEKLRYITTIQIQNQVKKTVFFRLDFW